MAGSRSAAEHLADIALKVTGQPRSAGEYEKQKAAKAARSRKSYTGAGDAARKQQTEDIVRKAVTGR